jgi:hypothetical protein
MELSVIITSLEQSNIRQVQPGSLFPMRIYEFPANPSGWERHRVAVVGGIL